MVMMTMAIRETGTTAITHKQPTRVILVAAAAAAVVFSRGA
jgi:hypothetical protein